MVVLGATQAMGPIAPAVAAVVQVVMVLFQIRMESLLPTQPTFLAERGVLEAADIWEGDRVAAVA
jgi:hypothetical protein